MLPDVPNAEADAPRIQLLGGFSIQIGSRMITDAQWRRRKAKSLVKLLALTPGHRLHREQVLEALWPDLKPDAAVNNLHQVLHAARRTLDPTLADVSRYLRLEGDFLVLGEGSAGSGFLWTDVEAFSAAAAAAHRTQEPQAYQTALALYTGELLPEDLYEDWTRDRRQQLRSQYLSLLLELGQL